MSEQRVGPRSDGSAKITIRVSVHLTGNGQYLVAIVSQEWQGAVRLDRRLARLRPLVEPAWYPTGVDRDVYRAWVALDALITEQRTDGLGQIV